MIKVPLTLGRRSTSSPVQGWFRDRVGGLQKVPGAELGWHSGVAQWHGDGLVA